MTQLIPATHLDLLERPLFAHIATIRADGTPQVTPIWFAWDGETLALTTSTKRAKYRQMRADPHVALSINDPDQPYRYLEVRGEVIDISPDPDADFFFVLAQRYGLPMQRSELDDAPYRVKIVIRPTRTTSQ